MLKPFSYGKKEKLKSRKLIEQLFTKGNSFTVFPVKIFYYRVIEKMDFPAKAAMGASSKYFPKAVHRSRIKRLLREAYRKEKIPLYKHLQDQQQQVAVFMLYVDKVLPRYNLIKNKMEVIINRLIRELNETGSAHI